MWKPEQVTQLQFNLPATTQNYYPFPLLSRYSPIKGSLVQVAGKGWVLILLSFQFLGAHYALSSHSQSTHWHSCQSAHPFCHGVLLVMSWPKHHRWSKIFILLFEDGWSWHRSWHRCWSPGSCSSFSNDSIYLFQMPRIPCRVSILLNITLRISGIVNS